ncbi:MAG: PqqD family protein [Deltaproteobacteria bacterium]|nr:PqqD family protein [Deltaproteobacteria bacterium]
MKIVEEQIICLKDDILCTFFEEGGVVFYLKDRVSHEINRTGARIIALLDGERDVAGLIQTIAREYGQEEKTIREDVTNFLKNLIKRGWVYVK